MFMSICLSGTFNSFNAEAVVKRFAGLMISSVDLAGKFESVLWPILIFI